jgi:hypothetical protein
MADAFGCAIGSAGDDHAAVAVAYQDGVSYVFVVQKRHDVVHMTVQVDACAKQVRALAQTGQRGGIDLVPFVS